LGQSSDPFLCMSVSLPEFSCKAIALILFGLPDCTRFQIPCSRSPSAGLAKSCRCYPLH
jgi:hypothetical protein